MYLGTILMVSDTLVGTDCGIIMDQAVLEEYSPAHAGGTLWTLTPGRVLLFADQIAAVYDNANPMVIKANKLYRKMLRRQMWRRSWYIRPIRWVRVNIRKLLR